MKAYYLQRLQTVQLGLIKFCLKLKFFILNTSECHFQVFDLLDLKWRITNHCRQAWC